MALRRRKRAKPVSVRRIHAVWNIIEEQREVFAAQGHHLLETLLQVVEVRLVAVADVQSRAERVDESKLALPAGLDEFAEPGTSTTMPAIYVYDLMFQRGQIAEGAAAAMMILAALALVLVPYSLWQVWRNRQAAVNV